MGDILDELSDIIEDGGAYSTRQPAQSGNHYSTGDSGLELDDFGMTVSASASKGFANLKGYRSTATER